MKNRYTLFVIMVSISVAVLIHFPELVSLLDILEGATLFPEMKPLMWRVKYFHFHFPHYSV